MKFKVKMNRESYEEYINNIHIEFNKILEQKLLEQQHLYEQRVINIIVNLKQDNTKLIEDNKQLKADNKQLKADNKKIK